MPVEPATILVVEIGSVFFFFLALPLALVLARLGTIWRTDRGVGLLLGFVVLLTGLLFALYLMGLISIAFARR